MKNMDAQIKRLREWARAENVRDLGARVAAIELCEAYERASHPTPEKEEMAR